MIQVPSGVLKGSDPLILLGICHVRMCVRNLYCRDVTTLDELRCFSVLQCHMRPRFFFVRKPFIGISAVSGKEYNSVKAMQSGQLSTKGQGSSVASATANKSGQVMQLRGHSPRTCGGQQYRWPWLLLIYEAWEDQCTNHISTTMCHQ